MLSKNYLLPCFLLLPLSAISQTPPVIEWEQTYGGTGEEFPQAMEITTDGGSIVVGTSNSNDGHISQNNGGYDVWIIKLDATGDFVWKQTYGGSQDDRADDVRQTNDGGYIVVGATFSNDGDVNQNQGGQDVWVLKLDANGNLMWGETYGGSGTDIAHAIQQTNDDGFILTGYTNSTNGDVTPSPNGGNLWVVKLDVNGTLVWEETYGGSGDEKAYSIRQTIDGGYIVGGYTDSTDGDVTQNQGKKDVWVLKLDTKGTLVWQESFGGSKDDTASFENFTFTGNDCIRQTTSGGYILVGSTFSDDGDVSQNSGIVDIWVIKLKSDGTLDWKQTYGQIFNQGASIIQSFDGNYVVAGTYSGNNSNGANDFWVFKIKSNDGTIIWKNFYGGNVNDGPADIQQLANCEFLVAGQARSAGGDVGEQQGMGDNGDYWVLELKTQVPLPVTTSPQSFCVSDNPTLADISVTGQNLQWYDENDNPLPDTTALQDGITYYVSQTLNGCESDRVPVTVAIIGENPPTIASDMPVTVCSGLEITYTTEAGYSNYAWNVSGGIIASGGGANDDFVVVLWQNTGNGTVSVSYDLGNGCGQSHTATYTQTVEDCDISIEKTVNNAEPEVGEEIIFSIIVNNLGNTDFTNVEVEERVPSGYNLINHTTSMGNYDPANDVWSINLLVGNTTETLDLIVEVLEEGEYLNTASLDTSQPIDTNLSNNFAQASVVPIVFCEVVPSEGFSPNGDGINEIFVIECIDDYPKNEVKIFNRHGRMVFEESAYDNQSSVFMGFSENGNELPTGTYFYVINLNGENGNGQYTHTGWVYLNR